MLFGVAHVEIIEHHSPILLQRRRDVAHHRRVVAIALEVAEAGEEVEDVVEGPAAERDAHVLPAEAEMWTFGCLRRGNAACRRDRCR